MLGRNEQTIERVSELNGFGLFSGHDVRLRFLPAEENHGIVFERTDLPGKPRVAASIENLAAEQRRTKLQDGAASVEMTEHLLASFAGLQIDNCLVQINAPELPGCDGSALQYAETLLNAGIVKQTAPKPIHAVQSPTTIDDSQAVVTAEPYPAYRISYELNYGSGSPIPPQTADFSITPETFVTKIASARTFVLESEIEYLRQQGYGARVTFQDLLVFGVDGPIENFLRAPNECARHKLLDCLGDLMLAGCDIHGHVRAFRSGHRHNHQLARQIHQQHQSALQTDFHTKPQTEPQTEIVSKRRVA